MCGELCAGSCVGGAARRAVWGNCVRELGGAVCVGLWGGDMHTSHQMVQAYTRHCLQILSMDISIDSPFPASAALDQVRVPTYCCCLLQPCCCLL